MVDTYYTMSTDFYEFGWGQSFHFAHRLPEESLDESIRRHEYYLASRLGLKDGMKCLDVGCGVGGPARNIARFSGADITGISINQYQIDRANAKTKEMGLTNQVHFRQGNFMDLPFEAESFDAAYEIEATCHAPDRTKCFANIFRVLKNGGIFAGYEWVMTDSYDPSDAEHNAIKKGIEVGDGLPDMTGPQAVIDALRGAGFIVEEYRDIAPESPVAWYKPFAPEYTISGIKTTPIGIFFTHVFVRILEAFCLAPKGTAEMHHHLVTASKTLYAGGKKGIFTPMFYFKARKPEDGIPANLAAEKTMRASVSTPTAGGRSRSRSASRK